MATGYIDDWTHEVISEDVTPIVITYGTQTFAFASVENLEAWLEVQKQEGGLFYAA